MWARSTAPLLAHSSNKNIQLFPRRSKTMHNRPQTFPAATKVLASNLPVFWELMGCQKAKQEFARVWLEWECRLLTQPASMQNQQVINSYSQLLLERRNWTIYLAPQLFWMFIKGMVSTSPFFGGLMWQNFVTKTWETPTISGQVDW
jgi:hypothetical protein